MKPSAFLTGLFCCLTGAGLYAQITCACTATTEKSHQQRSHAKHVTDYSSFKKKNTPISVKYMYKWQSNYFTKTAGISTQPNSPRVSLTPEDSLYVLEGYLWMVKTEENDCDFHMEIGTKTGTGTRMIVEVPKENTTVQNKIKQRLGSLGLHIKGCHFSGDSHFKTGLAVTVTGLGFYDASHQPNTNHGDAHTKKYSWELHPVKDIVFH